MQRSKNKSKSPNNIFFPEESDFITSVSGRIGNYQILTSKVPFWIKTVFLNLIDNYPKTDKKSLKSWMVQISLLDEDLYIHDNFTC